MVWIPTDEADAATSLGRRTLGAAVRRARLWHGLSQRQLAWYVGYDQTTISRLENAKLKGMRFSGLVRLIGMLSANDAFVLPAGPTRSSRRLPGEIEATRAAATPATTPPHPSYDADGHGLEDFEIDAEFGAYEAAGVAAPTGPQTG